MAFTGDLEHLPIVDVIQLMNSSRKSGVLSVKGRRGESQLVFKDGYIVSASHLNNSVRIGQLLIDLGVLTAASLEQALNKQLSDGKERRPLIVTLLDMGLVKEQDAYKGLQQLIEMTIVEILTWKVGTFTLETLKNAVECEFRYYPEKMSNEINLNTQSVLMDALRVFDEKVRDGLVPEDGAEEPPVLELDTEEVLSADLLGLEELDGLDARLPQAFTGLGPFNPLDHQMGRIRDVAPELTPSEQDRLARFLARLTREPGGPSPSTLETGRLVLFSTDPLLIHALGVSCQYASLAITTADSEQALEEAIDEAFKSGLKPWIVFDAPSPGSNIDLSQRLAGIRDNTRKRHPELPFIQLSSAADTGFSLSSYRSGVRAVIPRPFPDAGRPAFVTELSQLLEVIPLYLTCRQAAD
jgi:hypothetical protein